MENRCGCEFHQVNYHDPACKLYIPILNRLEKTKQRALDRQDFRHSMIREAARL